MRHGILLTQCYIALPTCTLARDASLIKLPTSDTLALPTCTLARDASGRAVNRNSFPHLPTCTLARDASLDLIAYYISGRLPTCTLARDASANITKMQAVCMEYIYIIYTLTSALTSYGAKRASESVTLLDFWVWSHPCRRCEGRANTLFTSPSHVAFH